MQNRRGIMQLRCINSVVFLVGWILSVHITALPATGAYCTVPPDSLSQRCSALKDTDFLSAFFGHEAAWLSRSCSATCHTPWTPHDELSLRLEIEGWLRANRTVGMFPEGYAFVWDEVMRLTNHLKGNMHDPQHEMSVYARRVIATLKDMPWLLVKNDTLFTAYQFYHRYVRQRQILRVLHLAEDAGEPEKIHAYLQKVAGWWAEAEQRISQDPRAPVPFLPWISLQQLIGPEVSSDQPVNPLNEQNETFQRHGSSWSKRRSFDFFPPHLPLPTALVYYYSEECAACETLGATFDLLPFIYRRLCEYGHHFITSCSPLVLFFRSSAGSSQLAVPTLMFYGLRQQPVPTVSVFVSFLIDVDDFFNPRDVFEGVEIPLTMNTSVLGTLVEILYRLAVWGIVQPRYLSPAEIAEMDQLEYEREMREKQANELSANLTTVAAPRGEGKEEGRQEGPKGAARRRGSVVSFEDRLRDVVMFHLKELCGKSATSFEEVEFFLWSQLEPFWLKVVSSVLCLLWLALWWWSPRANAT